MRGTGSSHRHCEERSDEAVHASAHAERWIASRYAELVPDASLREAIFPRIAAERDRALHWLLAISGQAKLLDDNPTLARSIRNRFPYLDPLNHVQVELLKEHRAQNPDEQVLRGIQLTINGISAGLRNTG